MATSLTRSVYAGAGHGGMRSWSIRGVTLPCERHSCSWPLNHAEYIAMTLAEYV